MGNLTVAVRNFVKSMSDENRTVLESLMAFPEGGDQVEKVVELRRKHGEVFSDVVNLVERQRQRLGIGYDDFRFMARVFLIGERDIALVGDMTFPAEGILFDPAALFRSYPQVDVHVSFRKRVMPMLGVVPSAMEQRIVVVRPAEVQNDYEIRDRLPEDHYSFGPTIARVGGALMRGENPELFGESHSVGLYAKDVDKKEVVVLFSSSDAARCRTVYALDRNDLAPWMEEFHIVIPIDTA